MANIKLQKAPKEANPTAKPMHDLQPEVQVVPQYQIIKLADETNCML